MTPTPSTQNPLIVERSRLTDPLIEQMVNDFIFFFNGVPDGIIDERRLNHGILALNFRATRKFFEQEGMSGGIPLRNFVVSRYGEDADLYIHRWGYGEYLPEDQLESIDPNDYKLN